MTCSEFDLLIVSDEPEASAKIHDHASGCPRCAEIMAGHAELLQEVEAWKQWTPAAPPHLEQRILRAAALQARHPEQTVRDEMQGRAEQAEQAGRNDVPARTEQAGGDEILAPALADTPGRLIRFPRRHSYVWGAIAATLILAALLVGRTAPWAQAPQKASRLLVAEALKDAVRAERAHARAIARLEQAAAPILARSEDPSLAASKAAVLIAYRDRLAFLDTTIAEIESFLDNNPSHSGGRTVLLAAYTEKTEVLGLVIALEEGWAS